MSRRGEQFLRRQSGALAHQPRHQVSLIPAGGILLVAAVVHYTTGRRFERD